MVLFMTILRWSYNYKYAKVLAIILYYVYIIILLVLYVHQCGHYILYSVKYDCCEGTGWSTWSSY